MVTRRTNRVLSVGYVVLAVAAVLALMWFLVPQVVPAADPAQRTSLQVKRVIDGDTVVVELDGADQSVRLIGIDTPETTKGKNECAGKEATDALRALVDGKPITLTADESQTDRDRYDRLLRYLTVDGRDAGEYLLERGLAKEYTYRKSDPYTHRDQYLAAQDRAHAASEGGWYACQW